MATPRRLFEPVIVRAAVVSAFRKLDPRVQVRNPVMFVVLVGSVLVTLRFLVNLVGGGAGGVSFTGQVALWLWFTVLFANFAEAMAEGRGKAQADELRKTRRDTIARRLRDDGSIEVVPASALQAGDQVMVEVGEVIPGDGEVVEGIASVDESAITGESAPVIREAGGDRSSVTGGTKVLSDWIRVRVTAEPGRSFLDRMIALVEGAERQKTPNEIALSILLSVLTIIFLVAVATLQPFAVYSGRQADVVVLVALLVCLIPTTIGALLSAIGIAGMDRMVQHNVLAMSGRAVEAAGDVNTLLLDKTGTITLGNREATELLPLPGSRSPSWPTPPSSPRSPTKPRRAARSWCWPRSVTACAAASCWSNGPGSSRSPPRPACPARTWTDARSARARRTRWSPGSRSGVARSPASWTRSWRASPAAAAPPWSWPTAPAPSAWSTSKTSSRAACATASTSSGGWASARS
jgi:K+-transporting ATPase B subunit